MTKANSVLAWKTALKIQKQTPAIDPQCVPAIYSLQEVGDCMEPISRRARGRSSHPNTAASSGLPLGFLFGERLPGNSKA
jgi:hypothetical protein